MGISGFLLYSRTEEPCEEEEKQTYRWDLGKRFKFFPSMV